MSPIARFLIPMALVSAGLFTHLSKIDRTFYASIIDARIYAKSCVETGRNKGGLVEYVFVVDQKAYEGQYFYSSCAMKAVGGLLTVKYVPEAPEKNTPASIEGVGVVGAIILAVFAYFVLVAFSFVIAPSPTKGRRKPFKSRQKPKR